MVGAPGRDAFASLPTLPRHSRGLSDFRTGNVTWGLVSSAPPPSPCVQRHEAEGSSGALGPCAAGSLLWATTDPHQKTSRPLPTVHLTGAFGPYPQLIFWPPTASPFI